MTTMSRQTVFSHRVPWAKSYCAGR